MKHWNSKTWVWGRGHLGSATIHWGISSIWPQIGTCEQYGHGLGEFIDT